MFVNGRLRRRWTHTARLARRPVWAEPRVRPWKDSERLWTLRRAAIVDVGPGTEAEENEGAENFKLLGVSESTEEARC